MKTYPQLFHKLFCTPLMLHAPVRSTFETTLIGRMFGESNTIIAIPAAASVVPIVEAQDPKDWRVTRIYQRYGRVAVIKIDGVIDKRISAFDMDCYGGCDLADVDAALAHAASDPRVEVVVLDIHSPGGSVIGVHETYTRICSLAETKEIHAFVNVMACSAGYYLAAAADHIAAAPSAIVGSIGVYIAMLDASRWYDEQGLKVNVMQGGKWKTMGADYKPLTDEERAKLQTSVDQTYAQFKAAVTDRRPQVEDDTMQGQWMDASEAQSLNLVDELTCATLDEYVSALLLS
jgi:protease-4